MKNHVQSQVDRCPLILDIVLEIDGQSIRKLKLMQ